MSEDERQPYEKPTLTEGLKPEPLDDVVRADDSTEDLARSRYTVADLVETDLEDPTTPSRRTRDGGAAGFDVPTEPIGGDWDRPVEDTPL